MAEMTLMLLKYPPSIGEQGIIDARRNSPQFIPSVPQVEEACEALFADTRSAITYAQAWDKRSKEQLAERDQIEAAEREESPEYRRSIAERIQRELAEKHGFRPPKKETWKRLPDPNYDTREEKAMDVGAPIDRLLEDYK